MKAAVYCGTKNLYKNMVIAAKSLLIHSDVDQIYFLTENDIFPYDLPPKTININISNQQYFTPDGPNYNTSWTYMAIIKVALSKIFPNLNSILCLDVDTIVNENISDIWNINLTNYYLAATCEPCKSNLNFISINAGVILFNLQKLREDKKDDELIKSLNKVHYDYPEQDCISLLCQNYIYQLKPDFNLHNWADYKNANHRKIIHFAAVKNWQSLPLIKKYEKAEIKFNQNDEFGLDIIIPAYKDIKGLHRTLKSVYYPEHQSWIKITVVDDCSNMNYTEIMNEFPNINYIFKDKNAGPGPARTTGRLATSNPYITYVDCGDIIFSKYSLYEIKDTLLNNTMYDLYQWPWVNGEWNTINIENSVCTPGIIYKREFLDIYNIFHCNIPEGAYSNEDIGFNHTCKAIINHIKTYDDTPHYKFFETPIYKMIYDKNSLTHKNKGEYNYTKQIPGLTANATWCIKLCEDNNVDLEILCGELNNFIISLYRDFLFCRNKRPELLEKHWNTIRTFYLNIYKKYQNNELNEIISKQITSKYIKTLLNLNKGYTSSINFKRFLKDLNNFENVPNYYYK